MLIGIEVGRTPVHIFTWPGLLMLYFLEIMPVVYVIVGAAYRSTNSSLEEAARINGSGVLKTFITVSVPIVRPAILLSMLLASVLAIGIYSIPAIVGSTAKIPTLSVHLVRLLNGEFPPRIEQAAVISLFLIAIFGAFWIFQQRLTAFGRHAQIGGQGLKSASILLSRPTQIIARTAMLAYIVLISVLPIVALLLVALQPYWTPEVDLRVLSFENFTPLFEDAQSRAAIVNSMMLGIVGSLITLLASAVVMVYAVNTGGHAGEGYRRADQDAGGAVASGDCGRHHDRVRRCTVLSGELHRHPRHRLFRALHPEGLDRRRGGVPAGRTATKRSLAHLRRRRCAHHAPHHPAADAARTRCRMGADLREHRRRVDGVGHPRRTAQSGHGLSDHDELRVRDLFPARRARDGHRRDVGFDRRHHDGDCSSALYCDERIVVNARKVPSRSEYCSEDSASEDGDSVNTEKNGDFGVSDH